MAHGGQHHSVRSGEADGSAARQALSLNSRFAKYYEGNPGYGKTADMVARTLREAILDGVLEPSSWLREAELARELSVSRTPVREALRRLSVEGLVVLAARQGAMVAPITIEDILKVYVVRENLEGLAARLAARQRVPQDLERMHEVLERMRRASAAGYPAEVARLNLEFHQSVRRAAYNQYLDRFLTQVEQEVRRFGRTTFAVPGRAEQTLEEHSRILAAIESGDAETAGKLAAEHMRSARKLRIRMLLDD